MRNPAELTQPETSGLSECLDRLAAARQSNRPRATYRLQFNRDFTFRDAAKLIPYLESLGISHCYASPLLKARPGSPHGYDIIDHNAINPEIGTEEELRALARELKTRGMGLVLDLVPNHMGVGVGSNPWWQDVLENGLASEYSGFFDIDWRPLRAELCGKVLLPVLGGSYGEELEQGHLKLTYDDGRFCVQYFETRLPIDPQTTPLIFETIGEFRPRYPLGRRGDPDLEELESLVRAFGELPAHASDTPEAVNTRKRTVPRLYRQLAELANRSAQVAAVVQRALREVNGEPGDSRSFDALHRLLEAQAYRLAHWRVSAEEINYRRFFDINDLVGLRMENPRVFAETHKLLRRLLADGVVEGLRIDHPDGLLNPAQYFTRLQMLYAASQCNGPEPRGAVAENGIERDVQQIWGQHDWIGGLLFVAAEKILERGEQLPAAWPIDGTTGYDFTNEVNGIFIDARQQRAFTTLYRRFLGEIPEVSTLIYNSKKLVLNSAMSGELSVLVHMLEEISSAERRARDFTRKSLADATREVIACFPVYRTYIDERGSISERDRAYINEAVARAKRRNESMPAAIFEFLRSVLLLAADARNSIEGHRRRLWFTLKFQQLTGPVMAKGLEDTACYAYNRFVSVNEVGGAPDQFGVSVDDFHAANMRRQESWSSSLLATTTHDTKRSEDVRARLNVISEMPHEWSRQALAWRRMNRARKKVLSDGRAVPDNNEEYLLYQTLAGIWPASPDAKGREAVILRVQDYMTKAVHEAKVNLSWVNPNAEYIAALREFIARILQPGSKARPNAFLQQLEEFIPAVVFFGALNSLAQTLLKLTSPGIPDIYQGSEIWNLSLVDPDNRRPVDFASLEKLLGDLQTRAEKKNGKSAADALAADPTQAAAKLWLTTRALQFRRENVETFRSGRYVPLFASGSHAAHICSFAREHRRQIVIVAVPRLSYTLMRGRMAPPLGNVWEESELVLPPRAPAEFTNVLSGEQVRAGSNRSLLCRELFPRFPAALLTSR